MKKKFIVFIALILIWVMTATLQTSNASTTNPYTDVTKKDYFYHEVIALTNDRIISGVSATKFAGKTNATRGETAQYIANALKLDTKNVKNPNFTDVPKTHKHYGAIAALYEKGIINGVSKTKFAPDNSLERYQIAKMVALAFELDVPSTATSPFKDIHVLNKELRSYIYALTDYSIAKGTTATTFAPTEKVKRQDLALFLYRAIETTKEFELISIQ